MDRSPSGTSFVGRTFGSYIGARVHELYCTCTEAVRDSAGDAAPCAKLEKRVNAGALQSAGLGLQGGRVLLDSRRVNPGFRLAHGVLLDPGRVGGYPWNLM